jgi:hypothetical protein
MVWSNKVCKTKQNSILALVLSRAFMKWRLCPCDYNKINVTSQPIESNSFIYKGPIRPLRPSSTHWDYRGGDTSKVYLLTYLPIIGDYLPTYLPTIGDYLGASSICVWHVQSYIQGIKRRQRQMNGNKGHVLECHFWL